jgi:hypothetical protein
VGHGEHHLDQRHPVGRGCATNSGQQSSQPGLVDHLLDVKPVDRKQPQRHVIEQLGEYAAGTESEDWPQRAACDPDQRFDTPGHHLLCEHLPAELHQPVECRDRCLRRDVDRDATGLGFVHQPGHDRLEDGAAAELTYRRLGIRPVTDQPPTGDRQPGLGEELLELAFTHCRGRWFHGRGRVGLR